MEIKRCPFDNKTASLVNELIGTNIYFYVQCEECGAKGPYAYLSESAENFYKENAKEYVVNAWNTRVKEEE